MTSYDTLIRESNEYLNAHNDRLKAEFGIGDYPRYDWDQWRGELIFSRDDKPAIVARIQFVGSISTKSHTWLWAWANNSYLESVRQAPLRVREYGERFGISKFTDAKWTANEVDGWEMTAVTARLTEAKGAYRTPGDTGLSFMVITDIERVTDRVGVFCTISCRHVVGDGEAVVVVLKLANGDVGMFCGMNHVNGDYYPVHLGHLLDGDSKLLELADLPIGWRADREGSHTPWIRSRIKDDSAH